MNSVSHIDIANCNGIRFAKTEVLSSTAQKVERRHHLLRAMLLNYAEHQPVNILFKNQQGHLFEIECAVIAVTDEHVMLKSGIILPVPSIVLIELL
ncbi:hypothetical protein [Nafulsella turpanensis]|uniref:hypothetical protein n=1 Tax=Nafulsella turpanensis TaxID=1265690 RepID=UPI00036472D4|nr:hypothetical protein [Nafulsella turpanensis]